MNTTKEAETITPAVKTDTPESAQIGQAEQSQAERPNKYVHALFADFAGERYLDTLLQQILPAALHRTWFYAVDFQAPGKDCFVGVTRLANRVKPGVRKIEIDLQELEIRGLMRRIPTRREVMQDDGSFKDVAVVIKDFTALYDLALEYHEWLHSIGQYIPPQREYKELIEADEELYHKLLRFDIYRRMLKNEKPGPKRTTTEVQGYYQQPTSAPAQNPNNYLDSQTQNHSAYRTSVQSNMGEVINLSNVRAANAGLRESPLKDAVVYTSDEQPVEAIRNVEVTTTGNTEEQRGTPTVEDTNTQPIPQRLEEHRTIESPRDREMPARAKTVLTSSSGFSSTSQILQGLNLPRRSRPTPEERAKEEQQKEALKPTYNTPPPSQADLDAQGRGRAAILRKAQMPAASPLAEIIPATDWKVLNSQIQTNRSTDGEYPDWLTSSTILISRALKDDEHIPSNKTQLYNIYRQLPTRNPDQFVKHLYEARARVVERQAKGKKIDNPFGYMVKCLKNDLGLKEENGNGK